MYRLVYKSVECAPFSETDLKKLLMNSRLRNTEAGLTGMLIYDRGTFLQMLEGAWRRFSKHLRESNAIHATKTLPCCCAIPALPSALSAIGPWATPVVLPPPRF